MKGLSLLVIVLVLGVVAYLIFKDKLALGATKAEAEGADEITKQSWEALAMSALQDLRIRL